MTTSEEQLIVDTLHAYRARQIEQQWEKLNEPDRERFEELWAGLADVGIQQLTLPAAHGGLETSAVARFNVLSALGAASPALAVAVVSHLSAVARLCEARPEHDFAEPLLSSLEGRRWCIAGPLFDEAREPAFTLASNGTLSLSGSVRTVFPHPDWLLVTAREGAHLRWVALPTDTPGLAVSVAPSAHGLRLLPFATVSATGLSISRQHVFTAPARAAASGLSDALLASVLAGMIEEMTARASAYAIERYQGGTIISNHDAVRQFIGPMLIASRAARALALEGFAGGPSDGGASAFAVGRARQSGLDAVQTFGGYGYMEDYRVERYLRDANTIDTFFVKAGHVERALAARHFATLGS